MSVHGIYSRILVFFFIQLAKLRKKLVTNERFWKINAELS